MLYNDYEFFDPGGWPDSELTSPRLATSTDTSYDKDREEQTGFPSFVLQSDHPSLKAWSHYQYKASPCGRSTLFESGLHALAEGHGSMGM